MVNNLVGTNATGPSRLSNHYGIVVASANNTIGGLTTDDRNLISGNIGPNGTDGIGVLLQTNARGVVVQGNLIGTDITGHTGSLFTGSVGNVYGIYFGTPGGSSGDNVSANTIGGTIAGAGNVISGNFVGITGNVTSSLIAGNTIGLAGPGSPVAVPNSVGILLGASGTTIGGTTPEARNVISASNGNGGTSGVGLDLTGDANLIQGNYVGAFLNSAADLPANAALRNVTGISLHVTNSTIGGTAAGAVITSGNLTDGLVLGTNVGNLVQGNAIGRTPDLLGNLPNGASGIVLALHADDASHRALADQPDDRRDRSRCRQHHLQQQRCEHRGSGGATRPGSPGFNPGQFDLWEHQARDRPERQRSARAPVVVPDLGHRDRQHLHVRGRPGPGPRRLTRSHLRQRRQRSR